MAAVGWRWRIRKPRPPRGADACADFFNGLFARAVHLLAKRNGAGRDAYIMAYVELLPLAQCHTGRGTYIECGGRELAVFRLVEPERVFVIDNTCPHANGNLSGGDVEGDIVTCPWHFWEFNLNTGVCVHSDRARVRRYRAELRDGHVWADLDAPIPAPWKDPCAPCDT